MPASSQPDEPSTGFDRFQTSSSGFGSARRPRARVPVKRTLAQCCAASVVTSSTSASSATTSVGLVLRRARRARARSRPTISGVITSASALRSPASYAACSRGTAASPARRKPAASKPGGQRPAKRRRRRRRLRRQQDGLDAPPARPSARRAAPARPAPAYCIGGAAARARASSIRTTNTPPTRGARAAGSCRSLRAGRNATAARRDRVRRRCPRSGRASATRPTRPRRRRRRAAPAARRPAARASPGCAAGPDGRRRGGAMLWRCAPRLPAAAQALGVGVADHGKRGQRDGDDSQYERSGFMLDLRRLRPNTGDHRRRRCCQYTYPRCSATTPAARLWTSTRSKPGLFHHRLQRLPGRGASRIDSAR